MITPNLQIILLQLEAATAGDMELISTCDRALGGDAKAREACFLAINAALVMANDVRDEADEIMRSVVFGADT